MARKDESLVERLEGCTRTLHFAGERITKAINNLADLEKYLKHDVTVISLFRLQVSTLRHEMEYLGHIQDKTNEG